MGNNKCEACKPGDATRHESAVSNTGCEKLYKQVDDCMKAHNGRISACVEEWNAFRLCHSQSKERSKQ